MKLNYVTRICKYLVKKSNRDDRTDSNFAGSFVCVCVLWYSFFILLFKIMLISLD